MKQKKIHTKKWSSSLSFSWQRVLPVLPFLRPPCWIQPDQERCIVLHRSDTENRTSLAVLKIRVRQDWSVWRLISWSMGITPGTKSLRIINSQFYLSNLYPCPYCLSSSSTGIHHSWIHNHNVYLLCRHPWMTIKAVISQIILHRQFTWHLIPNLKITLIIILLAKP